MNNNNNYSYLDQFKFIKTYSKNWRDSVIDSDDDLVAKYSGIATESLQKEILNRYEQGADVGQNFVDALIKNGQDVDDKDLETSELLDRVTNLTSEKLGMNISRKDIKGAILQKYIQDTIEAQNFAPDKEGARFLNTPVNIAGSITGTIDDDLNKSPVSGVSDFAGAILPYGVGFYLGANAVAKHVNPLNIIGRVVGQKLIGFAGGVTSAIVSDKVLSALFPNKMKEELGIPEPETSIWEEIKKFGMVEIGLTALSLFFPALEALTLFGGFTSAVFSAFMARKAVAKIGTEAVKKGFFSTIKSATQKYFTILGQNIKRNPFSTALGLSGLTYLATKSISEDDEEFERYAPPYTNDPKITELTYNRELEHLKNLRTLTPDKYNVNFARNALKLYDNQENFDIISEYLTKDQIRELKRNVDGVRKRYQKLL